MSLEVLPVDVGDADHPPPPIEGLLFHPFTLDITTPKGGGKTTLLINMIQFYKGYFHRVFVFSPSVNNDPKWMAVLDKPGFLAKNDKLESFLEKHGREDLLVRRDTAPGSSKKSAAFDVDMPQKSKKLKVPIIKTSGGRSRFIKRNEGIFLNNEEGTCVIENPAPPERRRAFPNGKLFSGLEDDIDSQWYIDHINDSTPLMEKFSRPTDFRQKPQQQQQQKQRENKMCPNGKITMDCVFEDNPETLKAIMNLQQEICDFLKETKDQEFARFTLDRFLFIFDDLPGSELLSTRKSADAFKILMIRHRHLSASNIIVAQAYKCIITVARNNISALALFRMYNMEELRKIWEEYPMKLDFKTWMQMYTYATNETYSFLFLNIQPNSDPNFCRTYKNFTEPLMYKSKELYDE